MIAMNNKPSTWLLGFIFGVIALLSPHTQAGSTAKSENIYSENEIINFAKSVEQYAANQGARVFIIARAGRPANEMPNGIQFTHTAIAIYSDIELTSGEKIKGYAIHNLYQNAKQTDKSELVVDYPTDFFWGVHALKAGIIIPTPEVQDRIIDVFTKGDNAKLHNSQYSVLANPFNSKYQNCTEHTLDIINSAIYQTNDIAQIKANTQAYFTPQRVKVSPLKLMLGDLFVDEVSTDDHKGKIYTATFSAIGRYLSQYELSKGQVVLHQNGEITQL
jgi:hypothetical protein